MAEYNITRSDLEIAGSRLLHAGDDYDYTFTITEGGVAKDLSSASVWFTIKEDAIDTDAEAKLSLTGGSGIDMTNAATGILVVQFASGSTANLEGSWVYDLQIKLTGKVITVAWGKIEFLPNITRATS